MGCSPIQLPNPTKIVILGTQHGRNHAVETDFCCEMIRIDLKKLPRHVEAPDIFDLTISGCNNQLGAAGKPALDHCFQVLLPNFRLGI